jgi:hypothetical protein
MYVYPHRVGSVLDVAGLPGPLNTHIAALSDIVYCYLLLNPAINFAHLGARLPTGRIEVVRTSSWRLMIVDVRRLRSKRFRRGRWFRLQRERHFDFTRRKLAVQPQIVSGTVLS